MLSVNGHLSWQKARDHYVECELARTAAVRTGSSAKRQADSFAYSAVCMPRPSGRTVMPGVEHRQHKGLNNRAENSHQPTRRRERIMKRFKSPGQAQRFRATPDRVCQSLQNVDRRRQTRRQAHAICADVAGVAVACRADEEGALRCGGRTLTMPLGTLAEFHPQPLRSHALLSVGCSTAASASRAWAPPFNARINEPIVDLRRDRSSGPPAGRGSPPTRSLRDWMSHRNRRVRSHCYPPTPA